MSTVPEVTPGCMQNGYGCLLHLWRDWTLVAVCLRGYNNNNSSSLSISSSKPSSTSSCSTNSHSSSSSIDDCLDCRSGHFSCIICPASRVAVERRIAVVGVSVATRPDG